MNISIQGSFRGLTGTAAVLAAALGLNMVGPHRAYAAPHQLAAPGAGTLGVTILSPDPHVPLAGLKPVEISAFYQGSPANQIIAVELFIDGAKAAAKTLDAPETRGVVSFLVDAAQISAGTHQVVVRATASDQEVQSAKSRFTFNGTDGNTAPLPSTNLPSPSLSGPVLSLPSNPALPAGLPPSLRLISPSQDGRVQGTITLHVEATDPSGKAPYVSLFIDKTFKTLSNFAPYKFDWDTTTYSNGYHTIEAYGYNDSPSVGHAKSLRLYVNNPGGETAIRHDLLDGVSSAKVLTARPARIAAASSKKRIAQPQRRLEQPLPAAQIASLMPSHPQSTSEIVRQLASGAGSLRFGSLDFVAQLSTPFAAEKPMSAPAKPMSAPAKTHTALAKPARIQSDKPLPAAPAERPAPGLAEIAPAEIAQTPAPAHGFTQKDQLPQIASIRLPGDKLVSPFVAVPHVKAWSAMAMANAIHPALKTPVQNHTLHVHLPIGVLNNLLRSAGQRILTFNQATVTMDRPLTVQNRVLFGPLRQIFEQGGGTLTWHSYNGTVQAKSATKDILLTLGDDHAQVNAKQVLLDGKPYLMLGRTMVPLSFIAIALDATVQFDAATGHLLVTSRK